MNARPGRGKPLAIALAKMAWLALVARKDTRSFYDAFSPDYDSLVVGQPNAAQIARFLSEYLQDQTLQPSHVLDLGCGTGLLSQHLVMLGPIVCGVDFSSGQLARAAAKAIGLRLAQADVSALPYRAETFDVVAGYQVLPHLPGREIAVFAEAFRVLRADGAFLVDPAASSPPSRKQRGTGFRLGLWMRIALLRATRIAAWTEIPTQPEVIRGLEKVGFRVEVHERVYERPWTFLVGRKP